MRRDIADRLNSEGGILFVTSNCDEPTGTSSDIDVYCVIDRGRSSVDMFYDDEGVWIEIFTDPLADLRRKIANFDEIAINFIRELPFVGGNRGIYQALYGEVSELVKDYRLPPDRKNLLKYRIKCLLSKYANPDPGACASQQHFLLNAISYPLVQLALEQHRIFPGSPKRWLMQLRDELPLAEFDELSRFLAHSSSKEDVLRLCDRYAGGLDPIRREKSAEANTTTFLS